VHESKIAGVIRLGRAGAEKQESKNRSAGDQKSKNRTKRG
jgi:hypothetical protein